eukprot:8353791-Ditylum_brightwellii.AAC.1
MNGCFNFDATPMAPLGTKVSVRIKPNKRATWGYHALPGWYIGTAMCKAHHNAVMPKVTHADRILKAARDLNTAISSIQSDALPDYVDTVHKLQSVLLKETPNKATNCPCAPNQPVEKSTAMDVEKEIAQTV